MRKHRGWCLRRRVNLDNTLQDVPWASVDPAIVAAGEAVVSGSVLGRITETGQYARFDPASDDGRAVAVALSFEDTDATDAPTTGHVVNGPSEAFADRLTWIGGLTDEQKTFGLADLAARGIKVR